MVRVWRRGDAGRTQEEEEEEEDTGTAEGTNEGLRPLVRRYKIRSTKEKRTGTNKSVRRFEGSSSKQFKVWGSRGWWWWWYSTGGKGALGSGGLRHHYRDQWFGNRFVNRFPNPPVFHLLMVNALMCYLVLCFAVLGDEDWDLMLPLILSSFFCQLFRAYHLSSIFHSLP